MTRTATFTAQDDTVGSWRITCASCPLKPHTDALGMPPTACISGIETNMQGHLPLKQCEFYKRDSLAGSGEGADKTLSIECLKETLP